MRNIAKVVAQMQLPCEQRACSDTDDGKKFTFFLWVSLFDSIAHSCWHSYGYFWVKRGCHPGCQPFLAIEKYFIKKRPLKNILTHHCLWCKHCNSKIQLPSIAPEAVPGNYFMKVYLLVGGWNSSMAIYTPTIVPSVTFTKTDVIVSKICQINKRISSLSCLFTSQRDSSH